MKWCLARYARTTITPHEQSQSEGKPIDVGVGCVPVSSFVPRRSVITAGREVKAIKLSCVHYLFSRVTQQSRHQHHGYSSGHARAAGGAD